MRAEAAQRINLGANRYPFPKDRNRLRTVNQPSAYRTMRLVPHNQNMGVLSGQSVTQVVQDPPAVAHAGSRQDETRAFDIVQALRVTSCYTRVKPGLVEGQ